jgi:hypothetical protein
VAIDLANGYAGLLAHAGHRVVIARYGEPDDPWNVAVECETCRCVLLDFDRPDPRMAPDDTHGHRCGNCGEGWGDEEMNTIQDYFQRVEPGGTVPSGECPNCGALCYPEDHP